MSDFIAYYSLPQMVPFLTAGHILLRKSRLDFPTSHVFYYYSKGPEGVTSASILVQ